MRHHLGASKKSCSLPVRRFGHDYEESVKERLAAFLCREIVESLSLERVVADLVPLCLSLSPPLPLFLLFSHDANERSSYQFFFRKYET